jgi:acyl-CoA synthetase (AMP-forming)/AMP-acid ligase II
MVNTNFFLENSYKTIPNKIALSVDDLDLTYLELYDQINHLTNALRALGCEKGCRVGFLSRNCAEGVILYYALSRLGAVFVPLDYSADVKVLCDMIGAVHPDMLFLGDEYLDLSAFLRDKFPYLRRFVSIRKKLAV